MATTVALHDGHAGNARQALALARALDPDAGELELSTRAPWRWLAPRRLPGSPQAFGAAFGSLTGVELAIGCGRQSALATRVLQSRGSRVVQILDPRIDPAHWDVVVAPDHDRLHGGNVVSMLGSLHPIDDLWLAASRRAFPHLAECPSTHSVLMVGGPTRHAALGEGDFSALLQALATLIGAEGGSFSVVASRRTPPVWRQAIARIPAALPGVRWCGDHDGPNPYAGLLGHADRIICTPDSVNMLSEAAATLAPVFAWQPHAVSGRPRRFLEALLERGRIRALGQHMQMQHFETDPLRETARVAESIRRRLDLPG